jgi:hypothetical protein
MSYKEMDQVTPNEGKYTCNHEKEEILLAPGVGSWILLPKYAQRALIMLDNEATGNGRIEVTNDLYEKIKADTPTAIPIPYITDDTDSSGNTSLTITAEVGPVKAVRIVNVSGETRLVLSAA